MLQIFHVTPMEGAPGGNETIQDVGEQSNSMYVSVFDSTEILLHVVYEFCIRILRARDQNMLLLMKQNQVHVKLTDKLYEY